MVLEQQQRRGARAEGLLVLQPAHRFHLQLDHTPKPGVHLGCRLLEFRYRRGDGGAVLGGGGCGGLFARDCKPALVAQQ